MATLKEALLGTEEQNKQGQANLDKAAQSGSGLAKFLGGKEKPEPVKPEEPKPEIKKAKGGAVMKKTKRFDEGGEISATKIAAMLGRGLGRTKTTSDELQDLLPSREKIGSALRNKLDPEIVASAINPTGAATRRILEAAKDVKIPRSYSDESGMKSGGKVKSASARADGCAIRGKTKA